MRVKINISYLPKVQLLGNSIDLTKPMKNTMDPAMNAFQIMTAKNFVMMQMKNFIELLMIENSGNTLKKFKNDTNK